MNKKTQRRMFRSPLSNRVYRDDPSLLERVRDYYVGWFVEMDHLIRDTAERPMSEVRLTLM